MAILIELNPEEEAQLRELAEQRGEELESLAGNLLRTFLPRVVGSSRVLDEAGVFHEDRWERVMASIQAGSASAPALPLEALSREALYSDHD